MIIIHISFAGSLPWFFAILCPWLKDSALNFASDFALGFVWGSALDFSSRIFVQEKASFQGYLHSKTCIFPSLFIQSSSKLKQQWQLKTPYRSFPSFIEFSWSGLANWSDNRHLFRAGGIQDSSFDWFEGLDNYLNPQELSLKPSCYLLKACKCIQWTLGSSCGLSRFWFLVGTRAPIPHRDQSSEYPMSS